MPQKMSGRKQRWYLIAAAYQSPCPVVSSWVAKASESLCAFSGLGWIPPWSRWGRPCLYICCICWICLSGEETGVRNTWLLVTLRSDSSEKSHSGTLTFSPRLHMFLCRFPCAHSCHDRSAQFHVMYFQALHMWLLRRRSLQPLSRRQRRRRYEDRYWGNVYVNSLKRLDRLHSRKERADQAVLEEYMELASHEPKTPHDDEWQAPRAWADEPSSSFLISKSHRQIFTSVLHIPDL